MANNVKNTGGDLLVWSIKSNLRTVIGANTYQLKKAVDVSFDISPAFELRFNDDGTFDVVPNGDIGSWTVRLPLTSGMVSVTPGASITTDDDKVTFTYWFFELVNKRFPPIDFDDVMKDNQTVPKTMNLKAKGILTGMRKVRTETEGIFDIELSGIFKPDATNDFVKS